MIGAGQELIGVPLPTPPRYLSAIRGLRSLGESSARFETEPVARITELHSAAKLKYQHLQSLQEEPKSSTWDVPSGRFNNCFSEARTIGPELDQEAQIKRLVELSMFVWGNVADSNAFLLRPNQALSGQIPLHLVATVDGVRRVEQVLNAIIHGLPA